MSLRLPLDTGWALACAAPGSDAAGAAALDWMDIGRPQAAAQALRAAGQWSLDQVPRRFDADDWWYRLSFDAPAGWQSGTEAVLGLDGLATLSQVWVNGQLVLDSNNMFVSHELNVGHLLRGHGNELLIVCRALDAELAKRRPRPRWRVPMLEQQNLRFVRTTLLGRTPGWSPPAAVVGPWRSVWLECGRRFDLKELSLRAGVDAGDGVLRLACKLEARGAQDPAAQARVSLHRAGREYAIDLVRDAATRYWQGELRVPDADLWWPHTHGEPALYQAVLKVQAPGGELAFDLGRVGFRSVQVRQEGGDFAVVVNGVPVFCRGACWTPIDPVTLHVPPERYAPAVARVAATGMNMLRVGGTMAYEADAFYDACDALGVLVWQDFMFANMDYPQDDAAWRESALLEVRQQLGRLQGRPALAVLCGNSEGEQQAAMWGAPREQWSQAWFDETLAEEAARVCPDVLYWPSSAHGGSFPYQADVGTTSYYGVGAYLREQADARLSGLRFATESLAFANVPEAHTLARLPGGLGLRVHHPGWKARSPRDLGAGWDFDDVRDHYLKTLFGVDPLALRYADHERYLLLSRVAVGEVMAAAFAEWRRPASTCRGALIWFWRDLWPAAGWGIVDDQGLPKAPCYYLQRALQPLAVQMTAEGGNGLYVHLLNEGRAAVQAELEISAWRSGDVRVAVSRAPLELPPRSAQTRSAIDGLDGFLDLSHAYRFGPPVADVVVASLIAEDGSLLSQAFAFPCGMSLPREADAGLSATGIKQDDGSVRLTVSTQRFAQAVHIEAEGYVADEGYFHLAPGQQRSFVARPLPGYARPLRGQVRAINALATAPIRVETPAAS